MLDDRPLAKSLFKSYRSYSRY